MIRHLTKDVLDIILGERKTTVCSTKSHVVDLRRSIFLRGLNAKNVAGSDDATAESCKTINRLGSVHTHRRAHGRATAIYDRIMVIFVRAQWRSAAPRAIPYRPRRCVR
ncbi:hypothetical protein EVAR_103491_1 [Eumeta japonica]|uniref:Uncharacterized protein n=1 Tax=Eumeta variegata TaxID=151549 RepID=A0A4C1ZIW7_EUMVA|nr:hypothetical protein EVAR_103491_1 [Eumeta japonica]